MPKFSKTSLEKLETCHPDLQRLFKKVIEVFDCVILEARRGRVEQNRLFALGRSRCVWPQSKHNVEEPDLSPAVDVAPYYENEPHVRWDKPSIYRWYYFAGVVRGIAEEMGIPIRWGGDWDRDTEVRDQTFNDLPHYELFVGEEEK